ncbi:MAG: MarR family transcriptional regulator [Pelagibacteraceae bacterium TMED233]|nr:MarR family transcriptional regulator [Candidatus Pelagibacter sp.]RPG06627.1 MAG: MarR family transcriptional regulator [Pelagibacteraceae bacterium TMED233]|tara:strand:- start:546 stop:932 length:387 start_codon:yes stop_codon:yes gene_type:complete
MGTIKISCALENCLELLSGKWKICILDILFQGPHRFGEIRKKLPNITIKMLSQALKELHTSDLIDRVDYKTKPLKVIYSISKFGETIKPVMKELKKWNKINLPQIHTSLMRQHYNKFKKKGNRSIKYL